MVKGSGLCLAAGAGSGSLREPGPSVDLVRTDSAAGVAARPGEGEIQQRTFSNSLPQVSRLRFVFLVCVDAQELGIKHPLHRKKLQLALQALGSEEDDNKGRLDYNWVTSEELRQVNITLP